MTLMKISNMWGDIQNLCELDNLFIHHSEYMYLKICSANFLMYSIEHICLVPCSKCSLYVLQHQPGLNTSPLIPTCGRCVVVAIARNCGSSTTSNVFCRKINSSESGEGKPFQLQKLENRSFWTNEEVTKKGLKVGCLLEYQVESSCQSHLGRSSKLFIFCGNVSGKPQVSFQQCSCLLIFEKLILS